MCEYWMHTCGSGLYENSLESNKIACLYIMQYTYEIKANKQEALTSYISRFKRYWNNKHKILHSNKIKYA